LFQRKIIAFKSYIRFQNYLIQNRICVNCLPKCDTKKLIQLTILISLIHVTPIKCELSKSCTTSEPKCSAVQGAIVHFPVSSSRVISGGDLVISPARSWPALSWRINKRATCMAGGFASDCVVPEHRLSSVVGGAATAWNSILYMYI
jgi:hypothetical protein